MHCQSGACFENRCPRLCDALGRFGRSDEAQPGTIVSIFRVDACSYGCSCSNLVDQGSNKMNINMSRITRHD